MNAQQYAVDGPDGIRSRHADEDDAWKAAFDLVLIYLADLPKEHQRGVVSYIAAVQHREAVDAYNGYAAENQITVKPWGPHPETRPIVVCTRDPDAANHYEMFPPGSVSVVDVDLGAVELSDPAKFAGWARRALEDAAKLPAEPRAVVEEIVWDYFVSRGHQARHNVRRPVGQHITTVDRLRHALLDPLSAR